MAGHILNPGTPGINLWNSLLTATNHHDGPSGQSAQQNAPANGTAASAATNEDGSAAPPQQVAAHDVHESNPQYHQFVNNLRNTGLTPNESNLRSGLTPGGINQPAYQFGNHVPYLNNQGMLTNPMTPGLSSLLGYNQLHPEEVQGSSEPQNNNQPPAQQPQVQQVQQAPQVAQVQQVPQVQRIPQVPQATQSEPPSEPPSEPKRATKRKANGSDSQSKRKKLDDKPVKSDTKAEPSPEDQTEDDKRKVFLERNRVAASKCRKRKKQLMIKMEEELAFYSSGYRNLSSQVTQIRDQLVNLRGILVAHKDCPKLASTVGGFEELQSVLQDTNYVIQLTSRSGANTALMPTTIPTTLNTAQENDIRLGQPVQAHLGRAVAPQHLGTSGLDPSGMTTRGSSDTTVPTEGSTNITPSNGQPISSHHSLTDLPAAGQNAMQNMPLEAGQAGDLRAINSMSNLSNLGRQQTAYQNGSFRPAASMVDLGQLAEQQPGQHNFNVDQRGFVGLAQSQT